MFLSDADRYRTDVSAEQRAAREAAASRQQARLLAKRDDALEREERRWSNMSAAKAAEERRIEAKRQQGLAAKKNAPSLPFNLFTLEYSHDRAGTLLKHQDDLVKYRSSLRTHNLYNRANGDYNPITGAPRMDLAPPPKPQTPHQ